jgi:hypothetical protein
MVDHGGAKDIPTITEVLSDPTASLWRKTALRSAFFRDLVDAVNGSEILASLLEQRCNQMLLGRLSLVSDARCQDKDGRLSRE